MKHLPLLLLCLLIGSCESDHSHSEESSLPEEKPLSEVEKYYLANVNDSIESKATGTVSRGTLENASIIPFEGPNFKYFDQNSYIGGRAFTHSKVVEITVATYDALSQKGVDRMFRVMEFSRKEGGKIIPHRTHQNGLSVDYMMPLVKNGLPCYDFDDQGASHYLLDFDKNGASKDDPSITIDFNTAAQHILELEMQARKRGMRIDKVIFNTYLLNELFATPMGQKLRRSGIYFAQSLRPIINELHDDHYHVDYDFL